MIKTYHPQAKFKVEFQYTAKRQFTLIDQTILQLLQIGNDLSKIPEIIGLPKRMVVESAFDLLKEQMIIMTTESLVLSSRGDEWSENLTDYERGEIQNGEADIFFDWNSYMTQVFLNLDDDWTPHNIPKEFIDLYELENSKETLVSFGDRHFQAAAWKDYTDSLNKKFYDAKNIVDVKLRSSLRSALKKRNFELSNISKTTPPYNCYKYGYEVISETPDTSYKERIPKISIKEEDWLLSSSEHCEWLQKAMDDSNSHMIIFSAHEKQTALNNLEADFKETTKNSFLVLGYNESNLKYKPRKKTLRHIADERSDSDMKVVLYDDLKGVVHLSIGSFNWLKDYKTDIALGPERNKKGYEISVVLHSNEHALTIIEVIETIYGQVRSFTETADKNKLLAALDNLKQLAENQLASTNSGGSNDTKDIDTNEIESAFLGGRAVACESGLSLLNAKHRSLVLSHTMSEKVDPLRHFENREYPYAEKCLVLFSDMYLTQKEIGQDGKASPQRIESYLASKQEKLAEIGKKDVGHVVHSPNIHSRLIINDDRITVTSLNCLSALGAIDKSFGIRFKDPESSSFLMDIFEDFFPKEIPEDAPLEDSPIVDMDKAACHLSPEELENLRKLLEKAKQK
ncbi:hypothetical protein [Maridesulfovibrio sp.]|uniref:hypothetical protein n=1 Tax=unclassified Maridesulfovibrio TaxID=2794999 RepID=UPI003AFF8DC3